MECEANVVDGLLNEMHQSGVITFTGRNRVRIIV
jgi:hypothetical protein